MQSSICLGMRLKAVVVRSDIQKRVLPVSTLCGCSFVVESKNCFLSCAHSFKSLVPVSIISAYVFFVSILNFRKPPMCSVSLLPSFFPYLGTLCEYSGDTRIQTTWKYTSNIIWAHPSLFLAEGKMVCTCVYVYVGKACTSVSYTVDLLFIFKDGFLPFPRLIVISSLSTETGVLSFPAGSAARSWNMAGAQCILADPRQWISCLSCPIIIRLQRSFVWIGVNC